MKIVIEEILVEDRARKDFGNLEDLKNSIERYGQLNDILVRKIDDPELIAKYNYRYKLIAGERRLRCHKDLGLTHINAKVIDVKTLLKEKELELTENNHEPFKWIEKAHLISDIHNLYQSEFGIANKAHDNAGWGIQETAELIGMSVGTVHRYLELAKGLEEVPELTRFESSNSALKEINRVTRNLAKKRIAELESDEDEKSQYKIYNDDAQNVLKTLEDESVDLIIFDPPWGTGADSTFNARGSGERAEYEDTPLIFREMCYKFLPELYRVLKNNSHMYMFFGIDTYHYLCGRDKPIEVIDGETFYNYHYKGILEQIGFNVEKVPLIWVKESGAWVQDHEIKLSPRYEMFFLMSKGFREIEFAQSNVFIYPRPTTTNRIHTQQKSLELIKNLIRLSTVQGNTILDPCMGSGVSIVAAIETKRKSIGIEKTENIFNAAKCWITGKEVRNIED